MFLWSTCLEDICIGQLFSAGTHAVQHEGQVLMILLPDHMKDPVLLRKAWRNKVVDVCKLGHKAMSIIKNLVGALVCVLAGCCQLRAPLEQGGCRLLDAHANLLLHALLIPLHGHSSCRAKHLGLLIF